MKYSNKCLKVVYILGIKYVWVKYYECCFSYKLVNGNEVGTNDS